MSEEAALSFATSFPSKLRSSGRWLFDAYRRLTDKKASSASPVAKGVDLSHFRMEASTLKQEPHSEATLVRGDRYSGETAAETGPKREGNLIAFDILRVVAMAAIVYQHLWPIHGLPAQNAGPFNVGQLGVTLFCGISGYFAVRPSGKSTLQWLGTRLMRIIPAYWIALTGVFIVNAVVGYKPTTVSTIVMQFLGLGGLLNGSERIGQSYWFITLILVCYAAASIVRIYRPMALVLLVAAMALLPFERWYAIHIISFLGCGILTLWPIRLVPIALIAAAVGLAFFRNAFVYPAAAIAVVIAASRIPVRSPRWVTVVSEGTYEFFLVHGTVYLGLARFFDFVLVANATLGTVIASVVAVGLSRTTRVVIAGLGTLFGRRPDDPKAFAGPEHVRSVQSPCSPANPTLLLTNVFPPEVGGSGRWLFEVYRRLPQERIVVAAGEHPQAAVFDESHGMHIERMPLKFSTWGFFEREGVAQYWRTARRLANLCREERITSIHCGTLLPEGWLAWLLKRWIGLPYRVFVHGEELRVGQQSRQLAWMMRRVLAGAEGVIANSQNTGSLLAAEWHVPAAKLHVVHPGCDCQTYVPASRDEAFRDLVGWSGRQVVLTVGRLQKRKGQDMLIRALPAIRKRVPNVLYAIVGDGEERAVLESLARTSGVSDQVQFLGEVGGDVLLRCYQQCDLFALPNREVNGDFEGFGMVLVEAQACGRAVLAGDSGGTRETMRLAADGENETGVIVDCTRPEPLADAVSDLLLDSPRRERMGRAGREWVLSQFDWPTLSEKVGQVLGMVSDGQSAAGCAGSGTSHVQRATAVS